MYAANLYFLFRFLFLYKLHTFVDTVYVARYPLCNATYKLDAETKVTKRFRNPRAPGCSVLSEARALLRARGFLNRLVTVGRGV